MAFKLQGTKFATEAEFNSFLAENGGSRGRAADPRVVEFVESFHQGTDFAVAWGQALTSEKEVSTRGASVRNYVAKQGYPYSVKLVTKGAFGVILVRKAPAKRK